MLTYIKIKPTLNKFYLTCLEKYFSLTKCMMFIPDVYIYILNDRLSVANIYEQ